MSASFIFRNFASRKLREEIRQIRKDSCSLLQINVAGNHKNVCNQSQTYVRVSFHMKELLFLANLNQTRILSKDFSKPPILKIHENLSAGTEFIRADRRTDGHGEANSRHLYCSHRALSTHNTQSHKMRCIVPRYFMLQKH
jgi:hypothetical protein